MIPAHLHTLTGNLPDRAGPIDFRPARLYCLIGPAGREDHEVQHRRCSTASTGKRRHELWGFGMGQGRMMANDTLRPLGQLFAQRLRQLGWIAKIKVVDVYVARDDCFDPPANTAGGHPLLDPDWPQQIMDMTWLDLCDRELANHRIGIGLQS